MDTEQLGMSSHSGMPTAVDIPVGDKTVAVALLVDANESGNARKRHAGKQRAQYNIG